MRKEDVEMIEEIVREIKILIKTLTRWKELLNNMLRRNKDK
jgi:hypothetical protein